LEKFNLERAGLDARASEADLYDIENKQELQRLIKRQAELGGAIDEAEMRWLELHEQLEILPEIA
jgi:ATP-binding cassette subfamily F protein 3